MEIIKFDFVKGDGFEILYLGGKNDCYDIYGWIFGFIFLRLVRIGISICVCLYFVERFGS